MQPGHGQLDLGAYVKGVGDTGVSGAMIEYQHHVTPATSVFAQGNLGYGWGQAAGVHYEATAGLRMRF